MQSAPSTRLTPAQVKIGDLMLVIDGMQMWIPGAEYRCRMTDTRTAGFRQNAEPPDVLREHGEERCSDGGRSAWWVNATEYDAWVRCEMDRVERITVNWQRDISDTVARQYCNEHSADADYHGTPVLFTTCSAGVLRRMDLVTPYVASVGDDEIVAIVVSERGVVSTYPAHESPYRELCEHGDAKVTTIDIACRRVHMALTRALHNELLYSPDLLFYTRTPEVRHSLAVVIERGFNARVARRV